MAAVGPFSQTTFMGASIKEWSCKIGFGDEASELTVTLVEDPCKGTKIRYNNDGEAEVVNEADSFKPVRAGKGSQFKFGIFEFGGILKSWEKTESVSGTTFRVTMEGPTSLMAGGKIVTKGMDGGGTPVPNMANLSDFCSEGGPKFDDMQADNGISSMPLSNRGQNFGMDLSALGNSGMRFTGDNHSALDIVQGVADSKGQKVSFDLIGDKVKPRLISQGPAGETIWEHTEVDNQAGEGDDPVGNNPNIPISRGVGSGLLLERVLARPENFMSEEMDAGGDDSNLHDESATAHARQKYGAAYQFANDEISPVVCPGGIVKRTHGVEYNNEAGSKLVRGEFIHIVLEGTGLDPFWGFSTDPGAEGEAILGEEPTFYVARQDFNLGGAHYTIQEQEMRAAGHGFQAWLTWMGSLRPDVILAITGIAAAKIKLWNEVKVAAGVCTDNPEKWSPSDKDAIEGQEELQREKAPAMTKLAKVHAWEKGLIDEFWGKKFAADLSGIVNCPCGSEGEALADEALGTKVDWEQTDGGWVEGGTVLGLGVNTPAMEMFKVDDGRVGCFVLFSGEDYDYSEMQSEHWAVSKSKVYVRGSFEKIASPCSSPIAVISIGSPVYKVKDPIDGVDAEDLDDAVANTQGGTLAGCGNCRLGINIYKGMGLDKPRAWPSAAAVPLKSKRYSYGPWSASTGPGKTDTSTDNSLSPWTFGSTTAMNTAGNLTASAGLSQAGTSEQGSIEIAGGPLLAGLGAPVGTGGPNLTSININASVGGITTTYNFRSEMRNQGQQANSRIEWMKHAAAEMRKRRRYANQKWIRMNALPPKASFLRQSKMNRWAGFGSTHAHMYAMGITSSDSASATKRDLVVTGPLDKVKGEFGITIGQWTNRAGHSNEGIFRPFDTKHWDAATGVTGTQTFAAFQTPIDEVCGEGPLKMLGAGTTVQGGGAGESMTSPSTGESESSEGNPQFKPFDVIAPYIGEVNLAINSDSLNPFADGHDIDYLVRGDEFPADLSCIDGGHSSSDLARGVGLRGPVVITGWGFDTEGFPVPNAASDYPTTREMEFLDGHMSKCREWMAGPLDVRWDAERKVWVAPPAYKIIRCIMLEDLEPAEGDDETAALAYIDESQLANAEEGPGRRGVAASEAEDPPKRKIYISDYLKQPIPKDTRILAFYDPDTCTYTAIGTEKVPTPVVTDMSVTASTPSSFTPMDIVSPLQLQAAVAGGVGVRDARQDVGDSGEPLRQLCWDINAYTQNVWLSPGIGPRACTTIIRGMQTPDTAYANGSTGLGTTDAGALQTVADPVTGEQPPVTDATPGTNLEQTHPSQGVNPTVVQATSGHTPSQGSELPTEEPIALFVYPIEGDGATSGRHARVGFNIDEERGHPGVNTLIEGDVAGPQPTFTQSAYTALQPKNYGGNSNPAGGVPNTRAGTLTGPVRDNSHYTFNDAANYSFGAARGEPYYQNGNHATEYREIAELYVYHPTADNRSQIRLETGEVRRENWSTEYQFHDNEFEVVEKYGDAGPADPRHRSWILYLRVGTDIPISTPSATRTLNTNIIAVDDSCGIQSWHPVSLTVEFLQTTGNLHPTAMRVDAAAAFNQGHEYQISSVAMQAGGASPGYDSNATLAQLQNGYDTSDGTSGGVTVGTLLQLYLPEDFGDTDESSGELGTRLWIAQIDITDDGTPDSNNVLTLVEGASPTGDYSKFEIDDNQLYMSAGEIPGPTGGSHNHSFAIECVDTSATDYNSDVPAYSKLSVPVAISFSVA